MDRLLNRHVRVYYSTGISDTIVVVDISPTTTFSAAYACDNSSWKVIDFDDSIVSQLNCCMEFIPGTPPVHSLIKHGDDSMQDSPVSEEAAEATFLSSDVHDNVRSVLHKHNIKSMKDLRNTKSLYIRDTGGQVEFQESLSLLVYGPFIFIFVMKTNIGIHTKNIIQYRSPAGEVINTYQSTISNADALLQFLSSVSAIQTTEDGTSKEGANQSHEPSCVYSRLSY